MTVQQSPLKVGVAGVGVMGRNHARVLGDIREIHVSTDRPIWPQALNRPEGSDPVPETLSWDCWLGVASERPYKKAWSLDQAVAFLHEGRGRHFDPDCLDAFMARWADAMSVHSRFRDEVAPCL